MEIELKEEGQWKWKYGKYKMEDEMTRILWVDKDMETWVLVESGHNTGVEKKYGGGGSVGVIILMKL